MEQRKTYFIATVVTKNLDRSNSINYYFVLMIIAHSVCVPLSITLILSVVLVFILQKCYNDCLEL